MTSDELDRPGCSPQEDGAILSSIRASIVSASDIRSSASARHSKPGRRVEVNLPVYAVGGNRLTVIS